MGRLLGAHLAVCFLCALLLPVVLAGRGMPRRTVRAAESQTRGDCDRSHPASTPPPRTLRDLTLSASAQMANVAVLNGAAKLRYRDCKKNECGALPEFENENCIHSCVSPTCFRDIFGAEPVRTWM